MKSVIRRTMTVAWIVMLVIAQTACTEDQLRKAATLSRDFRLAVAAAQDVEIAIYQQGMLPGSVIAITPEDHITIQQIFIDISRAGDEVNNAIRVAKSKPSALKATDEAIAATQRLIDNGVARVKNPQSKQQLTLAILSVRTILLNVQAALQ